MHLELAITEYLLISAPCNSWDLSSVVKTEDNFQQQAWAEAKLWDDSRGFLVKQPVLVMPVRGSTL